MAELFYFQFCVMALSTIDKRRPSKICGSLEEKDKVSMCMCMGAGGGRCFTWRGYRERGKALRCLAETEAEFSTQDLNKAPVICISP